MEDQLRTFRTLAGEPYRLLSLPMADSIIEDTERLPATYANFLILNESILYPTYNQPKNDAEAAEILAEAFPDKEIIGIDCRALIKQHAGGITGLTNTPSSNNIFVTINVFSISRTYKGIIGVDVFPISKPKSRKHLRE